MYIYIDEGIVSTISLLFIQSSSLLSFIQSSLFFEIMVPCTLLALVLVTVANAAPTFTERDLNSTTWTSDHILQPDEVILYGEGGRSMSSKPSPKDTSPTRNSAGH